MFTTDGNLVLMQNCDYDCIDEAPADTLSGDTVAAVEALIREFVSQQCPTMADKIGKLVVQSKLLGENGKVYITVSDEDMIAAYFTVQIEPAMQIMYAQMEYLPAAENE